MTDPAAVNQARSDACDAADVLEELIRRYRRDGQVLDEIALLLGTNPEWRSPADYLETIAGLVAKSGRPHPGDADPREYRKALRPTS